MSLNWDLCRVFYHVARSGSFSRAAAVLFTSQPAVSRSMAALEAEMGCRLFIRDRRGVSLTPEGRLLYTHVEAACEQLRRGREAVEAAVGLQSGSIAIGASETALRAWLLERLERFHALYPGVRIRLYGGTSLRAMDDLKSGAIDFAVAAVYEGGVRSLRESRLASFADAFVAGPGFEQLKGRPVSLQELSRCPLICHRRESLTFDFLESCFKSRGLEFCPAMEPDNTDIALELARHGLGVAFVPEQAAAPYLASGELFAVVQAEPLPGRRISLLEYEGHTLSLAAHRLRDMLLAEAEA